MELHRAMMLPRDTGLVLAGGAARGAYAAGVMRFLYGDLPKQLGYAPWPDVVSGASVGALSGAFAASRSAEAVERLARLWEEMRIEDVYRLQGRGTIRSVRSLFWPTNRTALLDASPLYGLVRRELPRAALREALDRGACRAFIVSATELATGFNALFLDSADPDLDLHPLPGTRAVRGRIEADHLLASAALPFLFPPVAVDGVRYVDGGLRQNTPLRPVLRTGIDRVLLVGAHVAKEVEGAPQPDLTPSLPFLAGKTLNALMLDPVERDLHNAEQLNAIIDWGTRRFGQRFAESLRRELGFQQVQVLFLRPAEDLGRLAADLFRVHPPPVSPPMRLLLSLAADQANEIESDLLSYLYFDRVFTGALVQMGYEDARQQEEELAAFFTRPSER